MIILTLPMEAGGGVEAFGGAVDLGNEESEVFVGEKSELG